MKTGLIAVIVATLASAPAFADLVITLESTDFEGNSAEVSASTIRLSDTRVAMETGGTPDGEKGNTIIYQGDLERVLIVDHSRRSYMVMDRETMERVSAQVNDAMKQMEEKLKELPPEQAAMMRNMMKGKMPSSAAPIEPVRVEKTGEKDTILDRSCVRYDVFVGEVRVSEMWVANWKSAGVKENSFQVMREMGKFYSDMLASLPNVGEMARGRGTMAAMNEIDGFPVLTRTYDGDTLLEETYYKAVTEQKVDPASYEPPDGYEEQSMPGGPATEGGKSSAKDDSGW